jgi:hypothetical protein
MAERTQHDILSSNVDSNTTSFYDLKAVNSFTIGENGEITLTPGQSTIPGIVNTTASYAITALSASYFSGSISNAVTAISASWAATASYFSGSISNATFATSASYAATSSYSKTLGASLLNDEGSGNARLALVSSDGTTISTVSYLTASLALTASFINGGTF